MNRELDLTCPKCGNATELITADENGSLMRVCPICATLVWNEEDGHLEIREPQEVTGEEKRQLLENSNFITADEEFERLRRSKKTEPLQ